jgi:hypothetical protein
MEGTVAVAPHPPPVGYDSSGGDIPAASQGFPRTQFIDFLPPSYFSLTFWFRPTPVLDWKSSVVGRTYFSTTSG